MDRHTLQHEHDPAGRPTLDARPIRRPAAPVVQLALDLQRQAGNRSVAALVGSARHASGPSLQGALADLTVPGDRERSTAAAARSGAPALSGATAMTGVQREPCTDCPDAAPTSTPETDGTDGVE